MFKIGQRVITRKPKNDCEYPGWVDDMDEYDGKEVVIKKIEIQHHKDGTMLCLVYGCEYWFNFKWIEAINESYWRI